MEYMVGPANSALFIDVRWVVLAVTVIAAVWFVRHAKSDWVPPLTLGVAVAVALYAILGLGGV